MTDQPTDERALPPPSDEELINDIVADVYGFFSSVALDIDLESPNFRFETTEAKKVAFETLNQYLPRCEDEVHGLATKLVKEGRL